MFIISVKINAELFVSSFALLELKEIEEQALPIQSELSTLSYRKDNPE